MQLQDNRIITTYSFYLIMGGALIYKFIDALLIAIPQQEKYDFFNWLNVFLFLIAGLLLILASYNLLRNISSAKVIGLIGLVFFFEAIGYYFVVVLVEYSGAVFSYVIKNFILVILAFITLALTVINWKKLP